MRFERSQLGIMSGLFNVDTPLTNQGNLFNCSDVKHMHARRNLQHLFSDGNCCVTPALHISPELNTKELLSRPILMGTALSSL